MAKKPITISPVAWSDAVSQKTEEAHLARVDILYNKVVDVINVGERVVEITQDELALLPAVDKLLLEQGFHVIRGLGNQALVQLVK